MRIFLSWSGEQSQRIAQALRSWLLLLFPTFEVWMSSQDIKAGDRWANELSSQLARTEFGILCLTNENMTSPWLLYEAGALSKSVETARIVPYLIDVDHSALVGPLSHFQAVRADKAGTRKLVQALSAVLSGNKRTDDGIDRIFSLAWPELEGWISGTELVPVEALDPDRPLVRFRRTEGLIIEIDEKQVGLSDRGYLLYLFLAVRSAERAASFASHKAAFPDLLAWLRNFADSVPHHSAAGTARGLAQYFEPGMISGIISGVRKKFDRSGLSALSQDLLPQKGRFGIRVRLEEDILPKRSEA